MPAPVPTATRTDRITVETVALLLAVVPSLVYLVGLPLHDGTAGTCDAWPGCSASAREQWRWTAGPWSTLGVTLATFLVAVKHAAPWLGRHPVLVRRASVTVLVLAVVVTVGFAALAAVVWGIDCSEAGWICFGGPEAALVLGSPALVTGVVAALLAVGLKRRERVGGRLAAWTLAGIVAGLVAVVVGQAAGSVLALVGAAWGT